MRLPRGEVVWGRVGDLLLETTRLNGSTMLITRPGCLGEYDLTAPRKRHYHISSRASLRQVWISYGEMCTRCARTDDDWNRLEKVGPALPGVNAQLEKTRKTRC